MVFCSPDHPESNGIAKRFMAVLAKVVHCSLAKGKDPRAEVQRRLLNYRNTYSSSKYGTNSSKFNDEEVEEKEV